MNDSKYIFLLSSQLVGFTKTGKAFNFRCPYCGDSQRKKNKKRGYIYQKNGKWVYYCHNCHISKSFKYFLKDQNETIYHEYLQEGLNSKSSEATQPASPLIIKTDCLDRLSKISRLPPNHPAKKFITSRQIPTTFHHKLYFTSQFKTFVNSVIPGKFENTDIDEARIIIPIYRDQKLVGFQGRTLGPSSAKYITIVLDETATPLIYGFDEVNWNSKFFVFEGPIDSMFIPNSIAVCGSSLLSVIETVNFPKSYGTLVFDNEPRNKDIVNGIRKAIKAGYRVCIFPATFRSKDVGEEIQRLVEPSDTVLTEKIVKAGWDIRILIEENTFFGLNAELKLAEWSKI